MATVVYPGTATDDQLTPSLDNTTDGDLDTDEISFESLVSVLVPLLFGCIAILGFIGNLLVIVVVVFDRQMRSSTNILIVSLAVADLLFIIFCVPFTAYRYSMTNWPFGDVMCKLYQYMANVTAYASVYTLVLMSLDRYLAVVHPVNSITVRTEHNTIAMLVVMWLVICLVNTPNWLEHGLVPYQFDMEQRSECVNLPIYTELKESNGKRHGRLVYGCFFTFAYFVPLLSICILYGFMLRKLLRGMVPGSSSGGSQSANRVRSKRRVTRMVVVVVMIFALCWLPIQILFVLIYFANVSGSHTLVLLQVVANCLAYMNSCVNPFLYAFLSENFRKSFCKVLSCQKIAFQSSGLSVPVVEFNLNNVRSMEPLTRSSAINHIGGSTSKVE